MVVRHSVIHWAFLNTIAKKHLSMLLLLLLCDG